jgi:hypothetical protein
MHYNCGCAAAGNFNIKGTLSSFENPMQATAKNG